VLAGDADHDRTVGPSDFNLLASNFGKTGKTWSTGDFDYDGVVGPADFNLLASNFGKTLPPPPAGLLASPLTAASDSLTPAATIADTPAADPKPKSASSSVLGTRTLIRIAAPPRRRTTATTHKRSAAADVLQG
jgi:hypothetical protein